MSEMLPEKTNFAADASPQTVTAHFAETEVPPIEDLPPLVFDKEPSPPRIGLIELRKRLEPRHAAVNNSAPFPWRTMAIGALCACACTSSGAFVLRFATLAAAAYAASCLALMLCMLLTFVAAISPLMQAVFSDSPVDSVISMFVESEVPMPPPAARRRYDHMITREEERWGLPAKREAERCHLLSLYPDLDYPTDAGGAPIQGLEEWGDF